MIAAEFKFQSALGLETRVDIGNAYGLTSDVAHALVLFALTASERPVVVDVAGVAHEIPRGSIRTLIVWQVRT
jgi:hypothetical protein